MKGKSEGSAGRGQYQLRHGYAMQSDGFYKEYAVPGQGLWNIKCRKGWQGLVYDES